MQTITSPTPRNIMIIIIIILVMIMIMKEARTLLMIRLATSLPANSTRWNQRNRRFQVGSSFQPTKHYTSWIRNRFRKATRHAPSISRLFCGLSRVLFRRKEAATQSDRNSLHCCVGGQISWLLFNTCPWCLRAPKRDTEIDFKHLHTHTNIYANTYKQPMKFWSLWKPRVQWCAKHTYSFARIWA